MPFEGQKQKVVFDFEDLKLSTKMWFETLESGYLKPHLFETTFSWGETTVYHENKWAGFLLDPTLRYFMIMIKNAFLFLGDVILNGMLEPPMTKILNNYQFPLKLNQKRFFPGLFNQDDFLIDFRVLPNIHPAIYEGYMDMYFSGQMIYKNRTCPTPIKDDNLHFYNSNDKSQIVIGASTATCWANQIASSMAGQLAINTKTFNRMFKVKGYNLNTTSVGKHVKIFQEKLGDNKPLKFDIWFEDFDVQFAKYEADVIFDYRVCFKVSLDLLGTTPLITDCLQMNSAMLVATRNDIFQIDMLEHKLNLNSENSNR